MPALSESGGEFIKIATTEGEEKGVSGKCRHVPNHSICAINQRNQVLLFVKNYFLKGKFSEFLQNISLIPNSGNYLNGWMQLTSIPSKRTEKAFRKKYLLQIAAQQAARSTDLQRTPLVMHSWFVSANYLFNEKKKGNATWIMVAFSRVSPAIKSNSPAEI